MFALLAAVLFGVGTPLIKLRFSAVDPILLAALINLGAALGVAVMTRIRWSAGPSGVAHAHIGRDPRALCGVPAVPEREAWPLRRRCLLCANVIERRAQIAS